MGLVCGDGINSCFVNCDENITGCPIGSSCSEWVTNNPTTIPSTFPSNIPSNDASTMSTIFHTNKTQTKVVNCVGMFLCCDQRHIGRDKWDRNISTAVRASILTCLTIRKSSHIF